MKQTIKLKGLTGDNISSIVDDENTNFNFIKFSDSGSGLKNKDPLYETVETMKWFYATKEDKELVEKIYNTEISDKFIWKEIT